MPAASSMGAPAEVRTPCARSANEGWPCRTVLSQSPTVRRVIGDSLTGVVLEGVDGRWHDLGAPDGGANPSLLIFWNPRCGFCQRLLPDLREVAAERRRAERVVLV